MHLKAGIIGSSGGSALAAAQLCIRAAGHALDLVVLSDRPCGLVTWARDLGYETLELDFVDRVNFSMDALAFFSSRECKEVLLFYTRLVAAPLIDSMRVWNIHPALLPAFPGLSGVRDAYCAGVSILGCTLHTVDAGIDTGPIFSQVACPVGRHGTMREWMRISFVQKVALTLIWYEYLASGRVSNGSAMPLKVGPMVTSHEISDRPLRRAFKKWESELELHPSP
jgi:phosphoribosylglycinamide formyltransferase-1